MSRLTLATASQRSLALLVATLLVSAAGCGDGRPATDDGGTPRDDGGRSDAGSPLADSGPHDAGGGDDDAGPLDAGWSGGMRRVPDVPTVNVGHESWDVVSIEAFNLYLSSTGTLTEISMLVRNDDPVLALCSLTLDIDLVDASGADVGFIGLGFKGRPMQTEFLIADCIAPGEVGIGYGNNPGAVDIGAVAEFRYSWFGSGSDVAVPYASVDNVSPEVVDAFGGGTHWALAGTLEVRSGTIRNPSVRVLPVVNGLLLRELSSTEIGDLGPGQSWAYETTTLQQQFSDYYVAMSFRGPSALHADTPEYREAQSVQSRLEERERQQEARRLPAVP